MHCRTSCSMKYYDILQVTTPYPGVCTPIPHTRNTNSRVQDAIGCSPLLPQLIDASDISHSRKYSKKSVFLASTDCLPCSICSGSISLESSRSWLCIESISHPTSRPQIDTRRTCSFTQKCFPRFAQRRSCLGWRLHYLGSDAGSVQVRGASESC